MLAGMDPARRTFVTGAAAAVLLAACKHDAKNRGEDEGAVGAVEDLMREHGVLRRALVVYREAATRLRADASAVPPDALQRTAKLFRAFGEDYHERAVEEPYVLPHVDPALAAAIKTQHDRGRAIQDWILAVTAAPKIGAHAQDLARVLDAFARMYESHTAREDTIAFPAWKKSIGAKQVEEMGEKFEAIEKRQLGADGFEHASKEMAAIEASLGLSDLQTFDAPPPPRA